MRYTGVIKQRTTQGPSSQWASERHCYAWGECSTRCLIVNYLWFLFYSSTLRTTMTKSRPKLYWKLSSLKCPVFNYTSMSVSKLEENIDIATVTYLRRCFEVCIWVCCLPPSLAAISLNNPISEPGWSVVVAIAMTGNSLRALKVNMPQNIHLCLTG